MKSSFPGCYFLSDDALMPTNMSGHCTVKALNLSLHELIESKVTFGHLQVRKQQLIHCPDGRRKRFPL